MLLPWKQLMGHPGVRPAWSLGRSDLVPRLLQRTPHTESALQHQPVLVSSLRSWAFCHLFQIIHSFSENMKDIVSDTYPQIRLSLSIQALKGAASELLYGWCLNPNDCYDAHSPESPKQKPGHGEVTSTRREGDGPRGNREKGSRRGKGT